MFGCQKFSRAWLSRRRARPAYAAARSTRARLGIPQNETRAVIIEACGKLKPQLLQLIECWPRAELAQHKHAGTFSEQPSVHVNAPVQNNDDCNFVDRNRRYSLRIASGVSGNKLAAVEQPFIDRFEINERFQCRSTTLRLRRSVNLRHSIIFRSTMARIAPVAFSTTTTADCEMS